MLYAWVGDQKRACQSSRNIAVVLSSTSVGTPRVKNEIDVAMVLCCAALRCPARQPPMGSAR